MKFFSSESLSTFFTNFYLNTKTGYFSIHTYLNNDINNYIDLTHLIKDKFIFIEKLDSCNNSNKYDSFIFFNQLESAEDLCFEKIHKMYNLKPDFFGGWFDSYFHTKTIYSLKQHSFIFSNNINKIKMKPLFSKNDMIKWFFFPLQRDLMPLSYKKNIFLIPALFNTDLNISLCKFLLKLDGFYIFSDSHKLMTELFLLIEDGLVDNEFQLNMSHFIFSNFWEKKHVICSYKYYDSFFSKEVTSFFLKKLELPSIFLGLDYNICYYPYDFFPIFKNFIDHKDYKDCICDKFYFSYFFNALDINRYKAYMSDTVMEEAVYRTTKPVLYKEPEYYPKGKNEEKLKKYHKWHRKFSKGRVLGPAAVFYDQPNFPRVSKGYTWDDALDLSFFYRVFGIDQYGNDFKSDKFFAKLKKLTDAATLEVKEQLDFEANNRKALKKIRYSLDYMFYVIFLNDVSKGLKSMEIIKNNIDFNFDSFFYLNSCLQKNINEKKNDGCFNILMKDIKNDRINKYWDEFMFSYINSKYLPNEEVFQTRIKAFMNEVLNENRAIWRIIVKNQYNLRYKQSFSEEIIYGFINEYKKKI